MAEAAEIPVPMLFELCSGGTAYEGKPQLKTRVKLDQALESLKASSRHTILAYTPYMLIIKSQSGAEISITNRGKLLIKRVDSEAAARDAAYEVMRITQQAFRTQPKTTPPTTNS